MEPPAITRHRRPFLAPLWVILLAALAVSVLALGVYRSATTTVVFLVQPLDKEPGTIADPPVTPEGEERAQRLAHMFGETGGVGRVDAVYVSDDRRALQTGAPLLERLHRSPVVFSPVAARAAADRAVREHSGGTVLMIASGSALGQMVQELAGVQLPAGAQDDPDLVCVVSIPTFGRARLVRFRY
jgi:broad specificity phosphatase PhoE